VALAVLVLAAGCSRCGTTAKPDAGTPLRLAHSMDLKSALFLIFPEYRGVVRFLGTASLTRVYSGAGPLEPALAQTLTSNGFTRLTDGGAAWERLPYVVEPITEAGQPAARLSFDFTGPTVERVMQAPAPVSSLELGLLLPAGGPNLAFARETFEVSVDYLALNERRGAILSRQVVDLLRSNGQWTTEALPEGWADAGFADAPDAFEATLVSKVDGARVHLERKGPQVRVILTLRTDARTPTPPDPARQ
jgi:hypothetical protein